MPLHVQLTQGCVEFSKGALCIIVAPTFVYGDKDVLGSKLLDQRYEGIVPSISQQARRVPMLCSDVYAPCIARRARTFPTCSLCPAYTEYMKGIPDYKQYEEEAKDGLSRQTAEGILRVVSATH